jgi:hypothetical protein
MCALGLFSYIKRPLIFKSAKSDHKCSGLNKLVGPTYALLRRPVENHFVASPIHLR